MVMVLCLEPAGRGALYGDSDDPPKGEGVDEEEAEALDVGLARAVMLGVGLARALMFPLLNVEASECADSSRVPLAELRPKLLTLNPESTSAFLYGHHCLEHHFLSNPVSPHVVMAICMQLGNDSTHHTTSLLGRNVQWTASQHHKFSLVTIAFIGTVC